MSDGNSNGVLSPLPPPQRKKRFFHIDVNKEHLMEDGRRLGYSAITAGVLGFFATRAEFFYYSDSLVLFLLGVVIWITASVQSQKHAEKSKQAANNLSDKGE